MKLKSSLMTGLWHVYSTYSLESLSCSYFTKKVALEMPSLYSIQQVIASPKFWKCYGGNVIRNWNCRTHREYATICWKLLSSTSNYKITTDYWIVTNRFSKSLKWNIWDHLSRYSKMNTPRSPVCSQWTQKYKPLAWAPAENGRTWVFRLGNGCQICQP